LAAKHVTAEENFEMDEEVPQTGPDLAADLTAAIRELVAREIATARREVVRQAKQQLLAAGALGGAAGLGFAALLLFLAGLAGAWALLLPVWASCLITAGITSVVALTMAAFGWSKRVKRPLPRPRAGLTTAIAAAREEAETVSS
jgi:hypothetical protein